MSTGLASETDAGWVVESSSAAPAEPTQAAPVAETSEKRDERARDESGRFAPKSAESAETSAELPPTVHVGENARESGENDARTGENPAVEGENPPPQPSKRSPEGRKLTLQQEIDRLTKQKNDELREIERIRQERQAYQPPTPPKTPEPVGDDFPNYDTWAEQQPEGSDIAWERYNRVLARHEAQQIIAAERKAEQAERARTERRTKELTLREKGKSVYSDWDEAIAQFGNDRKIPDLVYDTLLTDPDGHRLAYEIATHPDLADSWVGKSPWEIGVALGTLKARLAGASTAPPVQSLASTAPPPIKPVGSSPTQTPIDPMLIPFEKWTPEMVRKQGEIDRKRGRL